MAFDALVAAPEAPVFWRHPRARFVTVTPSSVTQLCQDHAQRSCREVLHFGYEYLAETWMVGGLEDDWRVGGWLEGLMGEAPAGWMG